jgi:predicted NACHT family NTPase/DNA-binding XRE family transcriptional regulator
MPVIRALHASPEGLQQAAQRLIEMRLTQAELAENAGCSRSTVVNFLAGKSVALRGFADICEVLNLDWKMIKAIPSRNSVEPTPSPSSPHLDSLVQEVRSQIEPVIRSLCGTMRVLDMDQPIELTGDRGIYTNVNILEKLTRLRSERELLENPGIEDFGRLGLGRSVRTIPGLEAVEKHPRLMVLGKPGAGKTTFLKYLAMQCVAGGLAAEKVPFFVTLKDFAEEEAPSLVEYLVRLLPKGLTGETVERLLGEGRSLVLLDGLDEVREEDTKRVIREMRETSDRFGASQFVVTCRIAAKEYTFERFTEVEVSDFDQPQIEAFVGNWFRAKNDSLKIDRFLKRLEEEKPLRELATSPLLLTLLCLVFGEEGDFPSNRSYLYSQGIRILLKKWDAQRNIQRDDHYKRLDLQRRLDLLSYVALKTFQEKEYFVKQRRIEAYIAEFIENLQDIDPHPESLRCDSEIMLRTIQAQQGLLVEQARGIYSFSHLIFQEYLAAREIFETNEIRSIIQYIRDTRWREIFLLTTEMLRSADELLLAMKSSIDLLLANDSKLQHFLHWVNQKSLSVEVPYKPAVVRAFYLTRDRTLSLELPQAINSDLAIDFDLALDLGLDFALDFSRKNSLAQDFTLQVEYSQSAEFKNQIQHLWDRLPNFSEKNLIQFKKWWKTNGEQWTEDLQQIMITHRNIGHDWQFTDDQKQLLQQYYDANLLLVQCLNSDCYVSRHVRESIEETLLLPMEELRMKNVELRK